jgi:hypothetical protein
LGRSRAQTSPGKKKKKLKTPPSQEKKLAMVACTCHPSNNGKHKIGGLWSMLTWAKSETRGKRAGGVAQVVESLPGKYEVLSSTPSAAQKKRLQKE